MKLRARTSPALVVVALLAVAGIATVASAQNILVNGTFEGGDTAGWEAFGVGASSTIAVLSGDNGPSEPGTQHAYLDNQAAALGLGLKQVTPVGSATGGEVFYSYDLKLDQADVGGVVFVEIFAEAEGVGIVGGSGLMGPLWPWNDWVAYTGSFIAPPTTDFLTFQVTATTGAATGSNCKLRVDNVALWQEGTVAVEATTWGGVKALFE